MTTVDHSSLGPLGAEDSSIAVRRISVADAGRSSRAIRAWIGRVAGSGSSLDLLYGGFDPDGGLCAAALLVAQPGRTGLLFPAPPPRKQVSALARVIDTCCLEAPREAMTLAQALVTKDERREAEALKLAGFHALTTLAYMQARIPSRAADPAVPAGVQLLAYEPSLHEAFIEALQATYAQTLDCPALRGLRDTRDVLAGHRAVGVFDPKLWTLVRIDGRPAGAVLLNRVPAAACVELVYLGIAPQYRRRGLAAVLLQRAMARCARAGEAYITLAVDIANTPAMALYRRAGFTRTAVRQVMIRPI